MCGAKTYLLVGLALACGAAAVSRKRVVGGATALEGNQLEAATAVLVESLTKLAAGDGPFYRLGEVISARKQVVSGIKYVFQVSLVDAFDVTKVCKVSIWSRPWLSRDGVRVTFDCPGEETVIKTHS